MHALLRSVLANVTRYYSFETRVANGELNFPVTQVLKNRLDLGQKQLHL